ncbi:MAG: hypothetical protein ACE5KD_00945 [Candidatus Bathyarchaeia archaeon]
MEIKPLIIGLVLGIVTTLASVWVYFLINPTARGAPIPPRVEFITTDLDTCTVDYVRSRFCQEIMVCEYEKYPSIMSEYWCTCHQ